MVFCERFIANTSQECRKIVPRIYTQLSKMGWAKRIVVGLLIVGCIFMLSTIILYHMLILTPYKPPLPNTTMAINSLANFEFPSPNSRFVVESIVNYLLSPVSLPNYAIEIRNAADGELSVLKTKMAVFTEQSAQITSDMPVLEVRLIDIITELIDATQIGTSRSSLEGFITTLSNAAFKVSLTRELKKMRTYTETTEELKAYKNDLLLFRDNAKLTSKALISDLEKSNAGLLMDVQDVNKLSERIIDQVTNLKAATMTPYALYLTAKTNVFLAPNWKSASLLWMKFMLFNNPKFTKAIRSFDGAKFIQSKFRSDAINLLIEASLSATLTEDKLNMISESSDQVIYQYLLAGSINP